MKCHPHVYATIDNLKKNPLLAIFAVVDETGHWDLTKKQKK